MLFWYSFLDPHLTTPHSNVGVQLDPPTFEVQSLLNMCPYGVCSFIFTIMLYVKPRIVNII